jgi:hypothetical protein
MVLGNFNHLKLIKLKMAEMPKIMVKDWSIVNLGFHDV